MDSKFVIQEEHFHTADHNCFVIIGWFDGDDPGPNSFEVCLDERSLPIQVQCLTDESVRQKYAQNDKKITKEYVVLIHLPENLKEYSRFTAYASGYKVYECSVRLLCVMQKQLAYEITDIQVNGMHCMLTGWAASEKPFKLTVYDRNLEPVQVQVMRFPLSHIVREYREAKKLVESGFIVTIPARSRKQNLTLQITDGEYTVQYPFHTQENDKLVYRMQKVFYDLRRNGIQKVFKNVVNDIYDKMGESGNYQRWREKKLPSAREMDRQRNRQPETDITILGLLPVVSSPYLSECLSAIKEQTFTNWKLLIAATAEEQEQIQTHLFSFLDPRLEYVTVDTKEKQRRVAELFKYFIEKYADKSNWAFLLDADDTLESFTFYHCVEQILNNPETDMLYTDEDTLTKDGKEYIQPIFKSDFNLDMLRGTNYLGHMVLIRGDLAKKVGNWDSSYGRAAVYDYYLRAVELGKEIGHLQQVLYHRRSRGTRYEKAQESRALNSHYERLGLDAKAETSEAEGIYHTIYYWKEQPFVSINIPNKDHIEYLDNCIQSVLKNCKYPNYEIIIIENNSVEERTFEYYNKVKDQEDSVRIIDWKESSNYSAITNFGVKNSKGDYILLLNNDTEVINPQFMEELLGYGMREDVGVCGARLYYSDDSIQHAGVIVGLGGTYGMGFQGFNKENGGYQNRIFCPQNYSAVTSACMLTKKSVFEAVGGMDEELQILYQDVDYCLKVRNCGKLVVYNPFATLRHYEYRTMKIENKAAKFAYEQRDTDIFTTRWAELIHKGDPYYSPNLTKRDQDFSLGRIELLL